MEQRLHKQSARVGSVKKAVRIIETIYKARRSLSVKEIADELGMNKSTVHHLLATLMETGFLGQDIYTKKYNIGLHLVEIGQAYLQQLDLRNIAHPFLEHLSQEVGETVHLLILDHYDVVYVDKVENLNHPGSLRCTSYIGRRTNAHATAAGKVLLAYLPDREFEEYLRVRKLTPNTEYTITEPQLLREHLSQIRQQGYALDLQEHEIGLQCVAVPIFNRDGRCLAALSVSGPASRINLQQIDELFLPAAGRTAAQISSALGYTINN